VTLLHIVDPDEWGGRTIRPTDEGFVHLSRPHKVCTPANLLFRGRRGLRLLVLDEGRVAGAVRVEAGFPHLYGAIEPDVVVDTVPFEPDDDGVFRRLLAPADPAAPPAADLVAAMVAEMEPLYGRIDATGTPPAAAADMTLPAGVFLVGWVDGEPVCGGGVKGLEAGVGEIKRMYVLPTARGGTGRWLLDGLEDAGRRLGMHTLRLDHGDEQPAAEHLYASAGYVEIDDYNGNRVATCWREKRIT
jgi:uncharacterized protein (DUF952 family)